METLAPSSERKAKSEIDDMFVLAPKRGPRARRTPRMPASRDNQVEQREFPAKPEKSAVSPPLALVPSNKSSADKSTQDPDPSPAPTPPADNPFRREPIPNVKLKLRELELRKDEPEPASRSEPASERASEDRESALEAVEPPSQPPSEPPAPDEKPEARQEPEPETEEADIPAPSADAANDDVEPPEPSDEETGDGAKPSADPRALLPIPTSLTRPRPVQRSCFLPTPAGTGGALKEPVRPEADLPVGDPMTLADPALEEPFSEVPGPVDPAPVDPIPVVSIPDDAIPVDEPVEPEAALDEVDPLDEPTSDPAVGDGDLPVPETDDLKPAKSKQRERLKHRQAAAFEAPDVQQESRQHAAQAKGSVLPEFRGLDDLLTDLSPSGVAVAGLVAISMILLIANAYLNPPTPPAQLVGRSVTLSIPERLEPPEPVFAGLGAEEAALSEAETPSDPLAGIVSYVGERVVAPADPATINPALASIGALEGLGQFARAAELTGLQQLLQPGQDYTIFVPNDAAFAELAPTEIERLLQPEGRDRLLALLSHHIVPGRLTFDDMVGNARAYTSLSGQPMSIDATDAIRIGDAFLINADLTVEDGVVHVIDTLLIPSAP